MFQYFLIVLIIKSIHSNLILNEDTHNGSDLIDFIVRVFENEFKYSQTALVIDVLDRDSSANIFLEKVSLAQHHITIYSVHLDNFTTDFESFYSDYKPDCTVIFVDKESYKHFDAIIFGIELFPFWNIRGTFLVVVIGIVDDDREWLRNTFLEFWDRQALRVFICFWSNGLKLFTYNPFLYNYGIDISNKSESDLSLMFKQKLTNMHRYPIKSLFYDVALGGKGKEIEVGGQKKWVGPDGIFQQCVCDTLNATLHVQKISDEFDADILTKTDVKLPYSYYVALLASIYDFDMLFNAPVVFDDSCMDRIFLYEKDHLHIIVPNEKPIPTYLTILLIVNWNVWCASLGSLVAVSITIITIRKFRHANVDIGNIFLDNYRFFLNESPPSRELSYQEQILIIFWVFHCIIFATLYQTIFTSTLVTPKYYPNMERLHDLFTTNIKVNADEYTKVRLTQLLTGRDKPLLNHLFKEDVSKYDVDQWIGKTEFSENVGFMIGERSQYEFFARQKSVSKSYYVIKEVLLPGTLAFTVRKDKYYYEEINMIFSRIQDAGLDIFWKTHNYGVDRPKMDKVVTEHSDSEAQVFGVEQLSSAFIILVFGYILATIGFCFEHIHKKYYK